MTDKNAPKGRQRVVATPTFQLLSPLATAASQANTALRAARDGDTQRALQYEVYAAATLRRAGLPDTCCEVTAVRRVLDGSRAILDGLDINEAGQLLDPTGRAWRPARDGDQIVGGHVFVPDDAPNRYDEHRDELGVMRVDGHAPDSHGDVAVEDEHGVLWIPLDACYLPATTNDSETPPAASTTRRTPWTPPTPTTSSTSPTTFSTRPAA